MKNIAENLYIKFLLGVVLTCVYFIGFANLHNVYAGNGKDYNINEIKDGVYVVSANGYNSMFLTTGKGVLVIDSPPSIGHKIFEAISEVTNEPIKYLVYSHSHKDHIGSADLFSPNVTIIAQKNTLELLTNANDPNRPIPNFTFENETAIHIGNKNIKLLYPGPYHQRGNIFIYLPNQKVLMVVDQITPGSVPWKHLDTTPEVPVLIKSYDLVLNYDFDVYVSGHGRMGTIKDVQIQKEYINDLKNSSESSLNTVNFEQATKEIDKKNSAAVTEAYFNALTKQCAKQMDNKWKDKLEGVGVWTDEHCEKMIQSLRVD